MLRFLKVAILLLFLLIVLFTYLTATGGMNGPGIWFLPFTIGLVFIPVIMAIRESLKKNSS
ncbi:MAG: hypothetical protein ABI581_01790 [Sediminibacterium sp.]